VLLKGLGILLVIGKAISHLVRTRSAAKNGKPDGDTMRMDIGVLALFDAIHIPVVLLARIIRGQSISIHDVNTGGQWIFGPELRGILYHG
jgi:hypothetical protein